MSGRHIDQTPIVNAPADEESIQRPIAIRDTPIPASAKDSHTPAVDQVMRCNPTHGIGPWSTMNRMMRDSRVNKAPAKSKQKPAKKECVICATTRSIGNAAGRGFRPLEGMCHHFEDTCNPCLTKMVKDKMSRRDLEEAVLACPFPECEHQLDYNDLAKLIFSGTFKLWDSALLDHRLRIDKAYMSCLNVDCQSYFSIEGCRNEKTTKPETPTTGNEIACPECEYKMCLSCMGLSHGTGLCKDMDKYAEINEEAIKALGAKPCPTCGTQIEKNGGCNHIICELCDESFCFGCLAIYGPNMKHGKGCGDGEHIGRNPANWLPDGVVPEHLMGTGEDRRRRRRRGFFRQGRLVFGEVGQQSNRGNREAPPSDMPVRQARDVHRTQEVPPRLTAHAPRRPVRHTRTPANPGTLVRPPTTQAGTHRMILNPQESQPEIPAAINRQEQVNLPITPRGRNGSLRPSPRDGENRVGPVLRTRRNAVDLLASPVMPGMGDENTDIYGDAYGDENAIVYGDAPGDENRSVLGNVHVEEPRNVRRNVNGIRNRNGNGNDNRGNLVLTTPRTFQNSIPDTPAPGRLLLRLSKISDLNKTLFGSGRGRD